MIRKCSKEIGVMPTRSYVLVTLEMSFEILMEIQTPDDDLPPFKVYLYPVTKENLFTFSVHLVQQLPMILTCINSMSECSF